MMKSILIELQNRYPNDADYGAILKEFTEWLHDDEVNKLFATSFRPGVYFDLKNNEQVSLEYVIEYWLDNVYNK